MARRPEHLVQAGQIDNTQPGWTVGWLELEGVDERLKLKLAGNCHPDLAGWKFRIYRLEPEPLKESSDDEPPDCSMIHLDQSGHVGEITADQMVKHHEMSVEELCKRLMAGEKPPFVLRKCLYLEWFSNHNGRVVIQSTRLAVERMGERAFDLNEEEWRGQAHQNALEMDHFMAQLGDAIGSELPQEDDS